MTVAAIHLDGWIVVPLACIAAALALLYWVRLGSEAVPVSRRRIRRVSLALMLASLPPFAAGLSFVDPQRAATAYVLVWAGAMSLLGLVLLLALVDTMNTVRLARQQRRDLVVDQAAALYADVRRRKGGAAPGEGES